MKKNDVKKGVRCRNTSLNYAFLCEISHCKYLIVNQK